MNKKRGLNIFKLILFLLGINIGYIISINNVNKFYYLYIFVYILFNLIFIIKCKKNFFYYEI